MRKTLTLGAMTAAALTFGATPASAAGNVTTSEGFKAEDMLRDDSAKEGTYGSPTSWLPSWWDEAQQAALVIDIAGGAAVIATWSAGIAMSVVAAAKGPSQDDQDTGVPGGCQAGPADAAAGAAGHGGDGQQEASPDELWKAILEGSDGEDGVDAGRQPAS